MLRNWSQDRFQSVARIRGATLKTKSVCVEVRVSVYCLGNTTRETPLKDKVTIGASNRKADMRKAVSGKVFDRNAA